MNYFKSGWSYLSSSFTQSEGDPNESSTNDLDLSENREETTVEGAVEPLADRVWLNPDDVENSNDDDLAEFADAVDNSKEQYACDADAPLQTLSTNSGEVCLESSEMPEVRADIKTANMAEPETAVSSEKVDLGLIDIAVEEKSGAGVVEKVAEDETKQPAKGYSSLEASDSDDSVELIRPPAAPVGIPTNTESQLNEIINNLEGDLGILTLEEENHLEQTLPGEKTLFVTAYDHTICSSPPNSDTTDVNIEADINLYGKTSRDSAIASSSKSDICGIESVELNETNSQFSENNNRPSTPLLASDALDHGLNETTSEQPFATSLLDVTVEEVEAELTNKVTEQENIIDPQPPEKEQSSVRVESLQQEVKHKPVNNIEHTCPNNIGEEILGLPVDLNSRIDSKNSAPIPQLPQESTVSAENKRESVSLEEYTSATPEPNSVAVKVENSPSALPTTQKTMDDPADAIPIGRGAYTIDYDDLDSFNPFQTSRAICNSPDLPTKSFPGTEVTQPPPVKSDTPKEQPTAIIESNHVKDTDIALPIAKALTTPTKPIGAILEQLPAKVLKLDDDGVSNEVLIPESVKITEAESVDAKNQNSVFELPVAKREMAHDNEDEPIPVPRGSYAIDFDKLDSLDPFKTSKGIQNSPTKPKSIDFTNIDEVDPFKSSKTLSFSPPKSPVKNNVGLLKSMTNNEAPDILPEPENKKPTENNVLVPSGELITIDADLENVDPAPQKKVAKKPVLGANRKKVAKPKSLKKKPPPVKASDPDHPLNGEEDIIIPKGSYSINFDDLDAMDPFQLSKGISNSPTKIASGSSFAPNTPKIEERPIPVKDSPGKGSSVDPPGLPIQTKTESLSTGDMPKKDQPKSSNDTDSIHKEPVKKRADAVEVKLEKPSPIKAPTESNNEEDAIPVSKGSYNLDFDNLDALDPFKSSKGLANSPTKNKPGFSIVDNSDNADLFLSSKTKSNSSPASPDKSNAKVDAELPKQDKGSTDDTKDLLGSNTSASKEPEATGLENEKKPQSDKKPKKKSSGLARKKLLKPAVARLSQPVQDNTGDELPPLPKGAYNLDFANLDTMDPFKSSKGLSDSPTKESAPPVSGYFVDTDLDSIDPFKPKKSIMNSPPGSPKSSQPGKLQSDATVSNTAGDFAMREIAASVRSAGDVNSVFQTVDETAHLSAARTSDTSAAQDVDPAAPSQEPSLDYKQLQQQEFDKINEDEKFYPASSVFQDSASLAYLDKLSGAKTLTASQLRKQSLYVKFDPLISDSPLKLVDQQISQKSISAGGDAANVIIDLKAAGDFGVIQKPQAASLATANASTGFDNHTSMDPYNLPYLSQQSYSSSPSTLKYTQADFESALRKAEQEWEKEKNEKNNQEETLRAELEQMSNVVKEYDRLFAEMSANGSRNGMLTREQQLLKAEHEQSLEDMAALERSHEDLCRRYNRLKTVVAQFKQNEDILKSSTNEMMEEARATEQKYVSLKVKADEEIKKANDELQLVKSNALQEVTRAQAQLKMLELKCESLQSQIRDCNRENEELTKLCDDLIACSKQGE